MSDTRFTWAVIMDLLDTLERAGYKRGDDVHTGRAIGLLWDAARIYAGEIGQPEAVPAIPPLIRGLRQALDGAGRKAPPLAVTLSAAQYAVVTKALADAETFRRQRAEAWCEHCDSHPSGACDQHVDDFDAADEYIKVAAELEEARCPQPGDDERSGEPALRRKKEGA